MLSDLVIQTGLPGVASLTDRLRAARDQAHDRFDVATAYLTSSGIQAVVNALHPLPAQTRWIIGLDDGISQPHAIEELTNIEGSEVRVVSLAPQRRFHPKIYHLWSSNDPCKSRLLVGSGNMTGNGLQINAEAAVMLGAENGADGKCLHDAWSSVWALGRQVTQTILNDYKLVYRSARAARAKMNKLPIAQDEPDITLSEPFSVANAWLDVGSATAQGREIELPKALTPFFGVTSNNELLLQPRFGLSDGTSINVSLVRRADNGMWRLGFRTEAINIAIGRPNFRPTSGGNRSDLAAVFSWISADEIRLTFVTIGTDAYQALIARTSDIGAPSLTQGVNPRSYGLF